MGNTVKKEIEKSRRFLARTNDGMAVADWKAYTFASRRVKKEIEAGDRQQKAAEERIHSGFGKAARSMTDEDFDRLLGEDYGR
ncbi:MAG: hypothetical protein LBT92_03080 [Rickettsiales bacterium]|jgi:hypothetical protein|nr:hypothetical protein [Rickettsiales bacterium]